MAEPQPNAYPEGTEIAGRYRVERVLGQGGMGMVLRARHTWTERSVALKVILPELAASSGASTRFLREAQSAASLRHPNVVDILDMGRAEDGTLYLAMELLDGEPLSRLLEREGPLDPFRAVGLLLPMIDALALAHRDGLVHRDIKPDNLFLANVSGTVVPKLLDFGIARAFRADGEKLTATGIVLGTPGYMAPEQVAGDPATPAADVWALGVVLFEALSGRPPFDAASALGWMTRVITEPAPALRSIAPDLPEGLAGVVDRCLSRLPEQRFQDAGQLAHALRRAVTSPIGVTVLALPGAVLGSVDASAERGERPSADRAERARLTPATRPSQRPPTAPPRAALALFAFAAASVVGALGVLGYWIDRQSLAAEPAVELVRSDAGPDAPALDAGRDAHASELPNENADELNENADVLNENADELPNEIPDEPATSRPVVRPTERRAPEVAPPRRAPRVNPEDM